MSEVWSCAAELKGIAAAMLTLIIGPSCELTVVVFAVKSPNPVSGAAFTEENTIKTFFGTLSN